MGQVTFLGKKKKEKKERKKERKKIPSAKWYHRFTGHSSHFLFPFMDTDGTSETVISSCNCDLSYNTELFLFDVNLGISKRWLSLHKLFFGMNIELLLFNVE